MTAPAERSIYRGYWNYKMWDAVFPVPAINRILQVEFSDIVLECNVHERHITYEARRGPREKELYRRMTELLGPEGHFYHPRENMIPRQKD